MVGEFLGWSAWIYGRVGSLYIIMSEFHACAESRNFTRLGWSKSHAAVDHDSIWTAGDTQ